MAQNEKKKKKKNSLLRLFAPQEGVALDKTKLCLSLLYQFLSYHFNIFFEIKQIGEESGGEEKGGGRKVEKKKEIFFFYKDLIPLIRYKFLCLLTSVTLHFQMLEVQTQMHLTSPSILHKIQV